MKNLWNKWTGIALVKRIVVGLILGAILGVAAPVQPALPSLAMYL